eukprot:PhF_6_TR34224/c0_g1_i2/m.50239
MDRLRNLFNKNSPTPPAPLQPPAGGTTTTTSTIHNGNASPPPPPTQSPPHSPGGPHNAYTPMHPLLQKHISHVKYNMKIVLRGAAKSGKTALFFRLQGKDVPVTYIPSTQISVATIPWSSPDSPAPTIPDTKVEVWDVIDESSNPNLPDATKVDVYRNCTMVLFMIDCTNRATLTYVEKEIKKVPKTCVVLMCCNFADMISSRSGVAVSAADVERLCDSIPPATTKLMMGTTSGIRASYIHTSMTTCLGLSAIHSYFMYPSALLRIQALEGQAEALMERTIAERKEFSCSAHYPLAKPPPVPHTNVGSLSPPQNMNAADVTGLAPKYTPIQSPPTKGASSLSASSSAKKELLVGTAASPPESMKKLDDAFFGDDGDDAADDAPPPRFVMTPSPRKDIMEDDGESDSPVGKGTARRQSLKQKETTTTKPIATTQVVPPSRDIMDMLAQAQAQMEAELEQDSKSSTTRHKKRKEGEKAEKRQNTGVIN